MKSRRRSKRVRAQSLINIPSGRPERNTSMPVSVSSWPYTAHAAHHSNAPHKAMLVRTTDKSAIGATVDGTRSRRS
jgi:hypothetical protein